MSEEFKNPSADDLTKTKKPGDIQLNEEQLRRVSGGIDGLKGESQDDKHKDA